jgi:RNA polymerase sigma-70 factor (ECF subfamily)
LLRLIGAMHHETSDTHARYRFESVVADVFDPLQRYLGRRLPADQVDDVLSETLLVMWRRLDDIPRGAPLPWCYSVARQTLANHRRATRRRMALTDKLRAQPRPVHESETEDPELDAALANLSESDREVIRLWAWEQLEPREISVVTGLTTNAVSLRLTRAKKKIERVLTRQNPARAGHIRDERTQEHTE